MHDYKGRIIRGKSLMDVTTSGNFALADADFCHFVSLQSSESRHKKRLGRVRE